MPRTPRANLGPGCLASGNPHTVCLEVGFAGVCGGRLGLYRGGHGDRHFSCGARMVSTKSSATIATSRRIAPLLDLSEIEGRHPPRHVLESLCDACENTGFFSVKGNSICQSSRRLHQRCPDGSLLQAFARINSHCRPWTRSGPRGATHEPWRVLLRSVICRCESSLALSLSHEQRVLIFQVPSLVLQISVSIPSWKGGAAGATRSVPSTSSTWRSSRVQRGRVRVRPIQNRARGRASCQSASCAVPR